MIIGSGLLAQAFLARYQQRHDVCIYAAGVSNSSCSDEREFERERVRLVAALAEWPRIGAFAYFGTCSVGDAEVRHTPYVQHKLAMESLVAQHPAYLILRLPQVAGVTPNPHTLLNFLHARIARSEAFSVWRNAYRNILDVEDVAAITDRLIADPALRRITMNLANPTSYSMPEIVAAMERVAGKRAVYDVLERGHHYQIDVEPMLRVLSGEDIGLNNDYLDRILRKYYERA
jgi:nucleoside-diphosphate-sugar epimerase